MNQEYYSDVTADRAVRRILAEERRRTPQAKGSAKQANPVWVVVPTLAKMADGVAATRRASVCRYVTEHGRSPVLYENGSWQERDAAGNVVCSRRSDRVEDARREIWIFGTRYDRCLQMKRRFLRMAKEKRCSIRFFLLPDGERRAA